MNLRGQRLYDQVAVKSGMIEVDTKLATPVIAGSKVFVQKFDKVWIDAGMVTLNQFQAVVKVGMSVPVIQPLTIVIAGSNVFVQ